LVLVALVNVLALARSTHPLVAAFISAVVTVAYAIGIMMFRTNTRLVVDGDQLRITAWSGRTRVTPRGDVGGAARRTVTWSGFPPKDYLVIYDRDMRNIKRLNTLYWDRSDLHALVTTLGYGAAGRPRRCSPSELNDEFNGAMSFWHRHNWLTGAGGALLFVAIAIALTLVLGR
jgi:hypothetical protein